MMQKMLLTPETLQGVKEIIDGDSSFLDSINIFKDSNKERKNKYISLIIDGKMSLNYNAFEVVANRVIEIQNSSTCKDVISKVSDVKTHENFSEFITFIEDDKEYFVIGDLHADLKTFRQILEAVDFKNKFNEINLIFLGDYVDRGAARTELINIIMLLKYFLPNNIYLLRGNHELYIKDNNKYLSPMLGASRDSNYFFSFFNMLLDSKEYEKMSLTQEQVETYVRLYAEFFDSMPTVALFNFENIKICATHGGLPRVNLASKELYPYGSFNKLLDDTSLDTVGIKQKVNMLWSDPYSGFNEGFRNTSDVRFKYSKNQFEIFCEKFDIDLMLRAHEVFENGYNVHFNSRIISVFSSGGRDKENENIINEQSYYENVSPNILRLNNKSIDFVNINFEHEPIASNEETLFYEDIKAKRYEVKKSELKLKKSDLSLKDIKNEEETLRIFDLYNQNALPVIYKKDSSIKIVHSDLEEFYGISKDLSFVIEPQISILTNYGIDINIGNNGAILCKNESVKISNDAIISIENGAKLRMVF